MPVTVVVGGQFGSEGKGKVAHEFARRQGASIAVRVGGSNSGHTVIDQHGMPRIFRHLPTAAILPDVLCVIPAGSYIDPQVLEGEVASIGLARDRLLIDPNAAVITEREKREEAAAGLHEKIGSTGSGTGAAVMRRIARDGTARFAERDERLKPYVRPTRPLMREHLDRRKRILIEGTQGFGLSLLHSHDYPHVTSRDTTAAAFVSEVGLSPLDVDDVILVIRAFPIRVAGRSGELPNEIDWKVVTKESGSREPRVEHTSVTCQVRRVARYDPAVVISAIEANTPTCVVLNHVDYVDATCANGDRLSHKANEFVERIEDSIARPIRQIGLGPASLIAASDLSRSAFAFASSSFVNSKS